MGSDIVALVVVLAISSRKNRRRGRVRVGATGGSADAAGVSSARRRGLGGRGRRVARAQRSTPAGRAVALHATFNFEKTKTSLSDPPAFSHFKNPSEATCFGLPTEGRVGENSHSGIVSNKTAIITRHFF
jgi:hypothetical protein